MSHLWSELSEQVDTLGDVEMWKLQCVRSAVHLLVLASSRKAWAYLVAVIGGKKFELSTYICDQSQLDYSISMWIQSVWGPQRRTALTGDRSMTLEVSSDINSTKREAPDLVRFSGSSTVFSAFLYSRRGKTNETNLHASREKRDQSPRIRQPHRESSMRESHYARPLHPMLSCISPTAQF